MTALLSPGLAAQLLDRVIAEEVLWCIDLDALDALETRLAVDLGRLHQITDSEMVDLALRRLGWSPVENRSVKWRVWSHPERPTELITTPRTRFVPPRVAERIIKLAQAKHPFR